jgi:hypothetical protein
VFLDEFALPFFLDRAGWPMIAASVLATTSVFACWEGKSKTGLEVKKLPDGGGDLLGLCPGSARSARAAAVFPARAP